MATGREARRGALPPLIGRDEIARDLRRVLERAGDRIGAAVVLSGPAGIGKSEMLRWTAALARRRGFHVLLGRALPDELPAPFSLLRDLARSEDDRIPRDAPDPAGEELVSLALAPFGTDATASARDEPRAPDDGAGGSTETLLASWLSEPAEGGPASGDELYARLADSLLRAARSRPLLIGVDDLQFADDPSLEFWRRFAPELARAAIVLVATVSPPSEHPARTREAIESLMRQPTVRAVPLRPMTVPEVGEFVRWISGGQDPDRSDVLRWHAQTEGNPLFVEQLVRTSIGGSAPTASRDPAPGRDVTEVLIARTRALGEAEQRLLTYAALLGKEFDFSKLVAAAGQSEERVTESLDRLVQDGLLREKGGEVYEFVTEAVRLHVYGQLTETRRRLLHRKVGRALEAAAAANDSELARQFYLGRDDEKAVEYNDRAAQAATRAFAYETAVAHLARALEAYRRSGRTDPRFVLQNLIEAGRLWEELGNLPRADEAFLEAVELARSHSGLDLELGRALIGLAQIRSDRAEYPSSGALASEAAQILERIGTPRDVMEAHRVQGTVAWRLGDFPAAEQHRRLALSIAETDGNAHEQGQALIDLANTMVPLGSEGFDRALALYTRAADLFATIEYHGAQARVLMNRAVLEYGAERVDDAFADLQRAIVAAERSHSPIWIGYCHINLAQWNAELGRTAAARAALDRAVQVVTPLGDRLGAQQLAMTRGMVAEAERAYDAAESSYQDALAQARTIGMPVEVSEMLYRLAHLAFARGDANAARERLLAATAAGIRQNRPDLGVRVDALERSLAVADLPR